MARARNIKPGFFINEDVVELPFSTRLLFIGLWAIADREGRLDDRPKKIKMAVFPADEVDVNEGLDQLASRELITRYVVDGERYIQVINFTRHQSPHMNEKPSEIPPAPCNSGACTVAITLNPDSLKEDSLKDEPRIAAVQNGDRQKKPPRKKTLTDEEFLTEMQASYSYIDVRKLNNKMLNWCKVNNKQATRRRLVNWLNREDVPIGATKPPDPGAHTEPVEKAKCLDCCDTGTKLTHPDPSKEWIVEKIPCPNGCRTGSESSLKVWRKV